MLKMDGGEYACIAEDQTRYNLGDVKEEMQAAMGLNTEVRCEVSEVMITLWGGVTSCLAKEFVEGSAMQEFTDGDVTSA